jgi:hypothetical protein
VKTRAVFGSLGFQEDWEAITDQRPAYYYDFGNLRLTAAEVMSDHFVPCFHFGGVWRDANSISMVDFAMPLEVVRHSDRAALAGLIGIGPQDELEGLMAAQLIATHNATMECYRPAMIAEQTLEGRRGTGDFVIFCEVSHRKIAGENRRVLSHDEICL